MTSKQDILRYPSYMYINGKLVKLKQPPTSWNIYEIQCHHYIEQQFMKKNPEKYKEIEHLQKLFFLPVNMHADLHAGCRKFKEKWGIERKELLYKLNKGEINGFIFFNYCHCCNNFVCG